MKNIALITLDCLRQDRCGFAGHSRNTTPNIDALASNSYVFTSAVAPGPRTSESFPGILAGRLSSECKFIDELSFKAIPEDAETLASLASKHGYDTVASISNPQLSPIRNFNKGFDTFQNHRIEARGDRFGEADDGEEVESNEEKGTPLVYSFGHKLLRIGKSLPVNPATAAFVAYRHKQLRQQWPSIEGKRVITHLMDVIPDDGPFFAWTHLNDLHCPIHPKRAREGGLTSASNVRQFMIDARRARHEQAPHYDLLYDSVVRYVDQQIGRFVEYLNETGLRDETAIIVTADHGEALYDRGIYGHAAGTEERLYESDRDYLYRELLDVPLIIDIPEDEGEVVSNPFSLLWLHQVVAEIMGVDDGDFPQSGSYSDVIFEADDVVLADAITEKGHTVAALNDERKLITDGIDSDSIRPDKWHVLSRRDRGDRTTVGRCPADLKEAAADAISSPASLHKLADEKIQAETMKHLADLGYR